MHIFINRPACLHCRSVNLKGICLKTGRSLETQKLGVSRGPLHVTADRLARFGSRETRMCRADARRPEWN